MLSVATLHAQDRPDPRALITLVQGDLVKAGFTEQDLADVVVTDHYTTAHTGVQHTWLRQRWQGIEVWNGEIAVHRMADGSLLKLNVGAFPRITGRVNSISPAIGADAALAQALGKEGLPMPRLLSTEPGHKRVYDGADFGEMPVTVQLALWPVDTLLRLVWSVDFLMPSGEHWWDLKIDALTGQELDRVDRVIHCSFGEGRTHAHGSCPAHMHEVPEENAAFMSAPNTYRVFAPPLVSPSEGPRSVVTSPWLDGGIASPFGWHDTNGAPGAEYTITRGNNVHAYEDIDGANATPGFSPDGGPTLEFDFPMNLAGHPHNYQSAAITNLFFWCNYMHDVLYAYGFDEGSGNFQQNNYGRGGMEGDLIRAEAMDGSGMNNANIQVPSDGLPPRMQMFLWNYASPVRTSDLENGVIGHEYAHGLSQRLVGGPGSVTCLGNNEQMGEGWSDYIGLMMTMKASDTRSMPRGVGNYLRGQPPGPGGIRPAPYSTDFAVNNYTYALTNLYGGLSAPHGIGFVWCTMLWEMTWDLIDLYGFSPDLYNGNGGNNRALRLVIDGMKLTPCKPGFVDARDAILAADMAAYGGAHQDLIRAAFARRGLGYFASQGSSSSRDDQVESFETGPLNNNLALEAIVAPANSVTRSCGPWVAKLRVRNTGLLPQSGFTVRYQVDDGPVFSQVVGQTLTHLGTVDVEYPMSPIELVEPGGYVIRAWVESAGDELPADDERIKVIELRTGRPVPHYFSWDYYSADRWLPIESGSPWFVDNEPHGWTCSSQKVFRRTHTLPGTDGYQSPLIGVPDNEVASFQYRRAYVPWLSDPNSVHSLRITISEDCGQTWDVIQELEAPAMATAPPNASRSLTSCAQWVNESVSLQAYAGKTVRLRFEATTGAVPGGRTFIDDLRVLTPPPAVEVAVNEILSPGGSQMFYCSTTSQPVSMRMYSGGFQPATGFQVGYQVNGGPWVMETFVGTMMPGTQGVHVFATPAQFPGPGFNTIEVKAFITDQNPANNSLNRVFDLVAVNTFDTPPWPEPAFLVTSEDGVVAPIEWNLQNFDEDRTWENVQVNTGHNCSTSRALRVDHFGYNAFGNEDRLVSPIYRLNANHRATLRFAHAYAPHTDPARADGFRVDVSADCGSNWTTVFFQEGAELGTTFATNVPWEPTNCASWRNTMLSLEAFDGQEIMLRFVAINGGGNRFFLDDMRLDQLPYVNAQLQEILNPPPGNVVECDGSGLPVAVVVGNGGAMPLGDIPVRYRVDNGPWVNGVAQGPHAPSSAVGYIFSTPLLGLSPGQHTVRVEVLYPGDQRPVDDIGEVTFDLQVNQILPTPFFEGLASGVAVPPGWELGNQDQGSTWYAASLPTGSPGTGCLSTWAWGRDHYNDQGFGFDHIITPFIDLSSLHGTRLKFDHAYAKHVAGGNLDGLRIEIRNSCQAGWTTVFVRTGSALITAPNYSGASWQPATCEQWEHHNISLSAYDGQTIQLRISSQNNYGGQLYVDNLRLMNEEVLVSVKLFLEGPYNSGTQTMFDDLRAGGLVPLIEPYSALGFQRVADPGATSVLPGFLGNAGNNSVVDWVMVELRKLNAPSQVVATRCVLVQRDGDLMRPDNASTTLRLPGDPGNYHIAVRHRNHLGAMTQQPVFLSSGNSVMVDFTTLSLPVFGTEPMRTVGPRRVLWSGNVTNDGSLKYTGLNNDRDPILQAIGGTVPSNTFNGYHRADVNMDGQVKYTGVANDRDPILQNVGGSVPSNTRTEQLP
ncbi:MAG: M36 family metallopeptidase [Flavobacteriales bacterium]|nr:M36 family metallopeptidase [Flavobacteriales bacterium]